MKYTKSPLTVTEQIQLLRERGLQINDESRAISFLTNISYYRLRAYTYPFQNNLVPDHPFTKNISLDQIIELYIFDRHLRLLVFDTLEKIEIALRTKIIYEWALMGGSHWHIDPTHFRDSVRFSDHLTALQKEIKRSPETFIEHYKQKYTYPTQPPAWMSLEVSSFGLLSLMFQNLKSESEKKTVTRYFGLNDPRILENWLHSFSNIRNTCAHHCRLWNRRFTTHIIFPKKPRYTFLANPNVPMFKLYAALSCMKYILRIISPDSNFNDKLEKIIDHPPFPQEKEMGFPKNWREESLWKS